MRLCISFLFFLKGEHFEREAMLPHGMSSHTTGACAAILLLGTLGG